MFSEHLLNCRGTIFKVLGGLLKKRDGICKGHGEFSDYYLVPSFFKSITLLNRLKFVKVKPQK